MCVLEAACLHYCRFVDKVILDLCLEDLQAPKQGPRHEKIACIMDLCKTEWTWSRSQFIYQLSELLKLTPKVAIYEYFRQKGLKQSV